MKMRKIKFEEIIKAGTTLNVLSDFNIIVSVEKDFVYNCLDFHAYMRLCAHEYFDKLCKVKK